MKRLLSLLLAVSCLLCGCAAADTPQKGTFSAGFGCVELPIPENSDEPLYIAGYHGGWEITGVLDVQNARALWLDDGDASLVMIVVDCIGLGSDTVAEIRRRLEGFSAETGCDAIHVVATHTHAGIDTLGLWGPVAMDGKNADFMETVISGAVQAAYLAYEDRSSGQLYYSCTQTSDLQSDSRDPQVYDSNLYQLRFASDDPAKNGIRLFSFAAHAESLRGDNTLVSRDYPGVVCDILKEETGDDAIYLPGAIGGLVMTPVLTEGDFDAQENLRRTGEAIAQYLLADREEQPVEANIQMANVQFRVELDNTLFIYYKFLGILGNSSRQSLLGQYSLQTELSVLQIGHLTLALVPGEIFPELVYGPTQEGDPKTLSQIAGEFGLDDLVVIGLADDELGYIVPPSDFILDPELPYFQEAEGDHYEETNSVGRGCAEAVAEAFLKALQQLRN